MASKGRPAHSLRFATLSSVIKPIVRGIGVRQRHKWDEGWPPASARVCSTLQRVGRGRGLRSPTLRTVARGFASGSEQMPNPISAVPSGKNALEWRTFLLKLFGKLLCQRPCCETGRRTSSCNAPLSVFVNAVNLAEGLGDAGWNTRLARLVTASKNNWKMSVLSTTPSDVRRCTLLDRTSCVSRCCRCF